MSLDRFSQKPPRAKKKPIETIDGERLIEAFVLAGKDSYLMKSFLEDVFTDKELDMFSRRLLALEMIFAGARYSDIENAASFSSATVSRIAKHVSPHSGFSRIMRKMHTRAYRYTD